MSCTERWATASRMEESDLLKKRVQAIKEKHHIQQLIRVKKVELDQEKVKLQHLKKKALREQWLLQDSASHTLRKQSPLCDQKQTRDLQLHIHSIEMDIYSLEREESRISTNENLILDRLKAVEKTPEELIKEVQVSFVPAMEVNITKNLLNGNSPVLSAAEKDMSCVSDLSVNWVGHYFYKHSDERHEMEDCGVTNHRPHIGNNAAEKDSNKIEKWEEHQLDDLKRINHSSLLKGHHSGEHRERLHYGIRPSDCHHQEAIQPHVGDYISVGSYSPAHQTRNSNNPTAFGRCEDNTPHSSLHHSLDPTQSITAIFMGFQAAEDDSQEFLGSLKAELIIIEDSEDDGERMRSVGVIEGLADKWAETQKAPGIRKWNKHKPCCAVC
ncbi:palmdelphin-like isoform X2 [Betta splendens]|uniref:Palmdelphin n=1 Tax=Betta splendens TaxID=158456 RepID=A0A9W2XCF9_BETSP|nr:palmdelphin-like isoform X2 [Betta splendens]XP_055359627.1 palmdelphin-like isoform X2 [Betta splendens]